MTPRQAALRAGSIPLGVLVVAGVWEIGQCIVDALRSRREGHALISR